MNNLQNKTYFFDLFQKHPQRIALSYKDSLYSYQQLVDLIKHWRKELNFIQKGQLIGLEGDFSPKSIAILFVLIEMETIVVPLDFNGKANNAIKYEISQIDVLLTLDQEDNISIQKFDSQGKNPLYHQIIGQHAGLVLFTSGSSGKPKAAVHNFSKLLKKFEAESKSLRTINFLLFDHWGGLNTLFHILSNTGTVYILENRTPHYICSIIEKYKVELLPTSPTFLNLMILSRAYEKSDLSSLKIISYGAEPMPDSLLKRLHKIFPEISLRQTYGLIELGVMSSKSENNDSLWVKLGGEGFETRIVDGILQIKSDSAMLGYLNAESPFTEDGFFITGDSVEEKDGYLKILGRKSELINVGGEKLFPQEVENTILELDFIEDVLVYAEQNAITGKMVCAKIKYESDLPHSEIVKKIRTHCRTKLQSFKIPVRITKVQESMNSSRFKKTRI